MPDLRTDLSALKLPENKEDRNQAFWEMVLMKPIFPAWIWWRCIILGWMRKHNWKTINFSAGSVRISSAILAIIM